MMAIQFGVAMLGGCFIAGATFMAIRARIAGNKDAVDRVTDALREHEAECDRRQERLWETLDGIRHDTTETKTTLKLMREQNNAR